MGFSPAGTVIASQEHAANLAGKAVDTSRESPIRPQTNEGVVRGQVRETSALLPMAETPHGTAEAPEVMETGEEDSEKDEARLPNTKKAPVGMTAAEWELHKLTHLPYNPACRCCVAGRKRDDQHRRRDKGPLQAQAELDAEGGASICAEYFFPKDAPGKEGVTAVALCDQQSGWLAAHVVDNEGSGTKKAVDQILRDLRRMGHHGKIVVKTDQESAIIDLLRVVAQQRGEARRSLLQLPGVTPKGMERQRRPSRAPKKWCGRSWLTWKNGVEKSSR